MTYTYAKGWFRPRKRPLAIWDEDTARKAHEAGKLYVVLKGTPEKPIAFLEINLGLGFVGANFLDEHLRDYLEYKFTEEEKGKLFLQESFLRIYDGDTDKVIRTERYLFKPSGDLTIIETNVTENTQETKVPENNIDVSSNWEKVPQFGDYESLLKIERS